MTKRPNGIALLTCLLLAAACEGFLVAPPARGADEPAAGGTAAGQGAGEGSAPNAGIPGATEGGLPVAGNYDYFASLGATGLGSYLAQVTARHASERVWTAYWAGHYTEALGDCEYVLMRFPNHPRALHLAAEIGKATNQLSMPIGYFENALSLYPQYAFTHAQYGHYLLEIGVVQAGVEQLRAALRLEPKQFQAQAWLSEALAAHPELAEKPSAN